MKTIIEIREERCGVKLQAKYLVDGSTYGDVHTHLVFSMFCTSVHIAKMCYACNRTCQFPNVFPAEGFTSSERASAAPCQFAFDKKPAYCVYHGAFPAPR